MAMEDYPRINVLLQERYSEGGNCQDDIPGNLAETHPTLKAEITAWKSPLWNLQS
jgi:hypothetical protein